MFDFMNVRKQLACSRRNSGKNKPPQCYLKWLSHTCTTHSVREVNMTKQIGRLVIFTLLVSIYSCSGPQGPSGPSGPQGPSGSAVDLIFIERTFSRLSYDEGTISIEDERIMPESFVNIYLKITSEDGREAYFPLDSLLTLLVGMPSEIWRTGDPVPVFMVFSGGIVIIDLDEVLLNIAIGLSDVFSDGLSDTVVVSLVVSILKTG